MNVLQSTHLGEAAEENSTRKRSVMKMKMRRCKK